MTDKKVFELALNFVLKSEGGYVNNPSDKGGATNKGVTQAIYTVYLQDKHLPTKDVKFISQAEVEDIYYNRYWLASGCDKMASNTMAMIVFDTAVNMGVGRAEEFLKASNNDPKKYLSLRIAKYEEFAKVPSQTKFLQGWLNRVASLKGYVGIVK